MRELNTEDFLKESDAYFAKFNEYLDKICEINIAENVFFNNGTITDEMIEENEKKREAVRKEYEGYDDYYHTDFFCWMTYENVNKLSSGNNIKYFKRDMKMIGKKVETNTGDIYGILKGIAVMVDDAYFVVDDEVSGKQRWLSAIIAVKPYDEVAHRGWQIVSNDKGYL